MKRPSVWVTLLLVSAPLFMVIAEVSAGTSPILKGGMLEKDTIPHQPKHSLVFFGASSYLSPREYFEQVSTRTKECYLADLVQQQHVNSVILTAKFGHLQRSYQYLWMAYGVFIPAGLVLAASEHEVTLGDAASWILAQIAAPGANLIPAWAKSSFFRR